MKKFILLLVSAVVFGLMSTASVSAQDTVYVYNGLKLVAKYHVKNDLTEMTMARKAIPTNPYGIDIEKSLKYSKATFSIASSGIWYLCVPYDQGVKVYKNGQEYKKLTNSDLFPYWWAFQGDGDMTLSVNEDGKLCRITNNYNTEYKFLWEVIEKPVMSGFYYDPAMWSYNNNTPVISTSIEIESGKVVYRFKINDQDQTIIVGSW